MPQVLYLFLYKLEFFLWSFNPFSPRKFSQLMLACWTWSLPDISRSSTYCRICISSPATKEFRRSSKARPNRLGDSVNPCGRQVHLSSCLRLQSGSSHLKANQLLLPTSNGQVQKASFKSVTENLAHSCGIWLRRVYGFDTIGYLEIVHLFISLKSCTNR